MEHFQDGDWADFVRVLPDPQQTAMMAEHVVNCAACRGMGRVLQIVADVARRDLQDWDPPDYVIAATRAIFPLREPERVRLLPRMATMLAYDSFLSPATAGLRGGQPMTRQTLYEAGPYAVDLRLDHVRGSRRVWLTGQIAAAEPHYRVDRLNVSLSAGNEVAASAITNAAGEFQLEYEPQPDLQLRIAVDPDEQIELPISSNALSIDDGVR